MKLDLTKEEVRILDNELFVAQCKLARLNLSVDEPKPTEEQKRYKDVVTNLRMKVNKLLTKKAIKKHLSL
tara:strand:- start:14172 stop:14381 length:210 start_codon:yes stop_codon:yes gene_type:complete